MDKTKLPEVWRQYVDGAITFVEYVRYAMACVTLEDVEQFKQYTTKDVQTGWPF